MRAKTLVNSTVGIVTEIVYALAIVLAAYITCIIFFVRP